MAGLSVLEKEREKDWTEWKKKTQSKKREQKK